MSFKMFGAGGTNTSAAPADVVGVVERLVDLIVLGHRSPKGVLHILATLVCVLALSFWMLRRQPVGQRTPSDSANPTSTQPTAPTKKSTQSTAPTSKATKNQPAKNPPPGSSARQSTVQWIHHKTTTKQQVQEQLIDKIQLQHSSSSGLIEDESAPVNILVCEGGGLKGHALVGMLQGLQEKNQGVDILQYFDLACGTSVGGITALILNRTGTTEGFHDDASNVLIGTRERSFAKLNWWNLLSAGSLTNQENDLGTVFHEKYGETPLYNPGGLKAFALTTVKTVGENNKIKGEPFLLRTYDVPEKSSSDKDGDAKNCCDDKYHFDGTSDVLLAEAMSATSAALGLASRVELTIDGETKKFADGDVIANNPTAIAVVEARRLWPKRPIGVVVSLALSDLEKEEVLKAVETTQKLHPSMHFALFRPPIKIHSAFDTDPSKLKEAEDLATQYILESDEATEAIEKLTCSGSRWSKKRKQNNLQSSMENPRFSTWIRASQMREEDSNQLKGSIWNKMPETTGETGRIRENDEEDASDSAISLTKETKQQVELEGTEVSV